MCARLYLCAGGDVVDADIKVIKEYYIGDRVGDELNSKLVQIMLVVTVTISRCIDQKIRSASPRKSAMADSIKVVETKMDILLVAIRWVSNPGILGTVFNKFYNSEKTKISKTPQEKENTDKDQDEYNKTGQIVAACQRKEDEKEQRRKSPARIINTVCESKCQDCLPQIVPAAALLGFHVYKDP